MKAGSCPAEGGSARLGADANTFFRSIPKDGNTGRFGHYFASHPDIRQRIAHLEDLIAQRGYPLGPVRPLPKELVGCLALK